MAGLIMFGGFALLLILGVPIALSLGASTLAAILLDPRIECFRHHRGSAYFWRLGFYLHYGHCLLYPGRQPDDQGRYFQ